MGDVLIDLGEVTRVDEPAARAGGDRRQPHPHRALLGAVTVVLAGTLAGAVHQTPPPAPAIIQARLGDKMFADENGVFLVGPGPEQNDRAIQSKIISWYAIPGGELRSRTTVAVTGPVFQVSAAGPIVLVSYLVTSDEVTTVALAEGTSTALWRRPERVLAASADPGVAVMRNNSPDFGGVRWFGVDVRTGAERWTVRQPPRGLVTLAGSGPGGFPPWLVTGTFDGRIDVRDTATGRVRSRVTAPFGARAIGADVPIWTAGDLLLAADGTGTVGYSLPGLDRRWRTPQSFAGRWVQPDCAGAICALSWQGGLRVVDPATGVTRWAEDRWNDATEAGPYLLVSDSTPQVRHEATVVDAGTGAARGAFGPWQPTGVAAADGTVIGLRDQLADGIVWYARLDPATARVDVLGRATEVAGDCRTFGTVLICRRLDAGVGLWRLR